jgi:hypothetical protein
VQDVIINSCLSNTIRTKIWIERIVWHKIVVYKLIRITYKVAIVTRIYHKDYVKELYKTELINH